MRTTRITCCATLALTLVLGSPCAWSTADAEDQAWTAVQSANSTAGYEAYLAEFPKGRYAAPARVKLAILHQLASAQPAAATAAPVATPQAERPAHAGYNSGISPQDLSNMAGMILMKKAGFPERRGEALRAAEAGDAVAQLLIGLSYEQGVGTFTDSQLKTLWLRKAADQGLPRARAAYAVSQIVGEGTAQDQAGGWNTLMQVARSGNAVAQYNAAMFILRGQPSDNKGMVQLNFLDKGSAVALLKQAASAGMAQAQYALGHAYMVGTDAAVPQNVTQARHWLSQAAALGVAEASSDLASMPQYEKQAHSGSSDTGIKLGVLAGIAAIASQSGIPLEQQVNVVSAVGTDLLSDGKTHATADQLLAAQSAAAAVAPAASSTPNAATPAAGKNTATETAASTAATALGGLAARCNTQVGSVVQLPDKQAFTAAAETCKSTAPEGFVWGTDSGDGHGTPEGSCKSALHAAFDGKFARTACYCYTARSSSAASAVNDGDWTCWVGEGG